MLALAVALAAKGGVGTAVAKERLVRQLGRDLGIPLQHVAAIAQDEAGYLWFGAAAGLYRYDGVDLRRWAPVPAAHLATGPDGTVYAAVQEGPVFLVTEDGAEPLAAPAAEEWQGTIDIELDAKERLWVLTEDGRAYRRSGAGGWEQPLSARLDGERPRRLRRDGDRRGAASGS